MSYYLEKYNKLKLPLSCKPAQFMKQVHYVVVRYTTSGDPVPLKSNNFKIKSCALYFYNALQRGEDLLLQYRVGTAVLLSI